MYTKYNVYRMIFHATIIAMVIQKRDYCFLGEMERFCGGGRIWNWWALKGGCDEMLKRFYYVSGKGI